MLVEIQWHEHGSRHEKFLQRVGEIFLLMTLIEFALVSENAIKKFCPLPLPPGGVGARFPPQYYAPELALTLLLAV